MYYRIFFATQCVIKIYAQIFPSVVLTVMLKSDIQSVFEVILQMLTGDRTLLKRW